MTALSSHNTSAHEDFSSAQIEAALINFLETLSNQNCSNATIRNYRSDIKQFYKHAQLEEIKEIFSKKVLKDFVLFQKQKGLKDSSVTRKIASITQFALWSKQQGLISQDVSWMTQATIESLLKFSPISIPNPPSPDKEPKPELTKKVVEQPKIEKSPAFLKLFKQKKTQIKVEKTPIKEEKTNKENIIGKFATEKKPKQKKIAKTARNFILPYLNLGLIVLFFIGLGFLGYNQLVTETPTSLAYPSTPTRPNRVLSFQGRLTDTLQNPITTPTDMEFKVWDQLSGGTEGTCDGTNNCEYKTGTCSVTPDQDGIFNVGIGDDCGSEIGEAVFNENVALWLEVKIDTETLTPRQPIRTVPFAVNSETVQGYPISASESATVNTILVMDSGGYIKLGEDSPKLVSDMGTFTISGYDISLEATNDLFFSDARVSDLPLSLVDTQIDAALGQGVVDAINDIYGLTVGGSFFDQTNNIIYPSEYWNDEFAIGGSSTSSADIWLGATGGAVFNEQGNDVDFRIEGDNAENLFFVDASTDRVGIGTNTPGQKLSILQSNTDSDSEAGSGATISSLNSSAILNTMSSISLGTNSNEAVSIIAQRVGTNNEHVLKLQTKNSLGLKGTRMTIDGYGNVGIGTTDPTAPLHVSGSYGSNAATIIDQQNSGDLLTASAAGTTRFILDNNGYVNAPRFVDLANSTYYLDPAATGYSLLTAGSIGVGDVTPASLFTVGDGDLFQVDTTGSIVSIDGVIHSITDTAGDLELSSAGINISLNDHVTFAGNTTLNGVAYTWPVADGVADSVLSTNSSGTLSWLDSSSISPFEHGDHFVYPDDYWADDLIIGGNSTASADTQLYADGKAVFNAQGNDADFQVEGQTNENLIFGDASTNRVGIGTNSPTSLLHVADTNGAAKISVQETAGSAADRTLLSLTNNGGVLQSFVDTDATQTYSLRNTSSLFEIYDDTDDAARFTVDGDGNVGIGDASPDHFLDVAGNIGLDASGYINWGDTDGTAGYGFRDDSGTLQYKSSGGIWTDVGIAVNTYWQSNDGSLSPISLTTDINLGNIATDSAKISLAGSLDRGKSAVIINQTEDQDVFTASASGTTLFTIQNSGNLSLKNDEFISNSTDDLLVFGGSGGTTDTDLTIDLDGSNPVLYSGLGLGIEINDRLYIGTNNRYFYDEVGQLGFSDDLGVDASLAVGTVNSTGNVGEIISSSNIIIDNLGDLRLRENSSNGSNYTGFQAPDSLTDNLVYTLPDADGSVGTVLMTDGAGELTWGSNSAGDYWQQNAGMLSPVSLTLGLNLGATATSSAKISLPGSLDRGMAALIVNQTEAQDIFTASASGTTRFTIDTDGNLDISGNIGLASGNYVNWGSVLGTSGYGFRDSGGTLQFKHDGGTWQDVGTGGAGGGGTLGGYWDLSAGSISPYFPTTDVNIGDSATASAKVSIAGSLDRGMSALIINQSEDEDIFTASASGTTRLHLTNAGDLDVYGSGNFGNTASIDDNITLQAYQNYADVGTDTTYTNYFRQRRTESALTANTSAYGTYNLLELNMAENGYNATGVGNYNLVFADNSYTYNALTGTLNSVYSTSDALTDQDNLRGSRNLAFNNGTGTVGIAIGSLNQAYNQSTGSVTNAYGVDGRAYTIDGTVGTATGVRGYVYETGGAVTTGRALYADCDDAATCYGLYIDGNDVDSTTAYGIFGENGDWALDQDGGGSAGDIAYGGDLLFGEEQDAGIWYDGTDLKINPRLEGSGDFYLINGDFKTELGQFESNVADGGSSTAYEFNTVNELTVAGSLIADFQNQGTSMLTIDKDGNLWAKGNIYSDKGFGVSMKNIGVDLSQYDLVVINTTEDNTDGVPRMSATTSAMAKEGFGVVQESCTSGSTCKVVFQGESLINVSNSTSRGQYLYSSTTQGQAVSHSKQYDGLLGIATSDDTSDPYLVEMIFMHQPSVDKLRVADKNRMHADYREAAIDYTYANETNYYDIDENVRKGLYFDTFQDKIKIDSSNSDSLVDDVKERAGLFGGVTMNATNTDTADNTYLGSADANDVYYYDRSMTGDVNAHQDSTAQTLIDMGMDPNWFNGVSLVSATNSGALAANPPANLSTRYNGGLIKATGRYTTGEEDGPILITIKSDNEATDSANPSLTFDWKTIDGSTPSHSGSDITTPKGAAYTLETGTTDISITFSQANYHAGDMFKIASWYLEPTTANDRGSKQQFPQRANIIAGNSDVDIIDADTNKLWMRFDQGTDYAIGVDTDNDPSSIHMVNGRLYVGTNGSAPTGMYEINFANDGITRYDSTAGFTYLGDGLQDRNTDPGDAYHNNASSTSLAIVSSIVNDVHANTIPNHETKEVTISGWGYINGASSKNVYEEVIFPHVFDSTPNVVATYAGVDIAGTTTSLSDCTSKDPGSYQYLANAYNEQPNVFSVSIDTNYSSLLTYNYCYTWTATGTVSPKSFSVAGTDGGATVVNEDEQTQIDLYYNGTYKYTDLVWLTTDGQLYYEVNDAIDTNNVIYLKKDVPAYTVDRTAGSSYDRYYRSDTASAIKTTNTYNSADNEFTSIYVTENTSTSKIGENTLYLGTESHGLQVIQTTTGNGNMTDGTEEIYGSLKTYTKDYISEEMVGSVKGMWPLNGNNTASDLEDVSALGNNVTAVNITSADTVPGVRGEAYDFDGSTEYLLGTDDADFEFSGDFAISTWIKTDDATSLDPIFAKGGTSTGTSEYGLWKTGGKIQFALYNTASGHYLTATTIQEIADDQWHHVVGTIEGTTLSIYIDGQLAASSSSISGTRQTSSAYAYAIGTLWMNSPSVFFDGIIDEVMVTGTAISAQKAKDIYETGKRALQNRSINIYKSNLDEDGTGNGAHNSVSSVGVQISSETPGYGSYAYVAMEDGDGDGDGWINKIDLGSDTVVQSFTTATNPSIPDNDATSIAVSSAGLELVGMDGVGAVSPGLNSNSNDTSGTYYSDTIALPEDINNAYAWINEYIDSDCATCGIAVSASNDGGSTYVSGTLTSTDNNQSLPEKEYLFSFPAAGNSLKFKVDFTRDSSKDANVYIEKYGIAWFNDDDVVGGSVGGVYTESSETVANGDYVELSHGQNTNDIITNGWLFDVGSGIWKDVSSATESGVISNSNSSLAHEGTLTTTHNKNSYDVVTTGWEYDSNTSTYKQINEPQGASHNTADANLEAYWTMDEASGDLTDSSSNNKTLIDKGTPTYGVQGKVEGGDSITLNGTTDYFCTGSGTTCANDTDFDFSNTTFSTSLWFKNSGTTADFFVTKGANNASKGWAIGINYTAVGKVQYQWNTASGVSSISTDNDTFNDGHWHHLSVVSTTDTSTTNNNNAHIYIDGVKQDTTAVRNSAYQVSTYAVGVGAGVVNGTPSYYYEGEIDDIAIYSDAITIEEIQSFYDYGKKRYKIENDTIDTTTLTNLSGSTQNAKLDVSTSGFRIVQTDENTVRLYNYSGSTQNLRLDVSTGGTSSTPGAVSLAPIAADVDAYQNNSSIWINKTDETGNLLRLQNDAMDRFTIDYGGNATLSGSLKLNGQLQLGSFASSPTAMGDGSMYYNSTDDKIYFYNGLTWGEMGGGGGGTTYWQENSGALTPISTSLVTNFGDIATDSAKVSIAGSLDRGMAAVIINQTEDQDIFTASASGLTKFVIDNDGYVGIGTSDPTSPLEIDSTANKLAQFSSSNNDGYIQVGDDEQSAFFGIDDNYLFLSTDELSSTPPFVIDTDGLVGIGTNSPISQLDIEGSVTGQALVQLNETGDQDVFTASVSGVTRMRVDNDGYVHSQRFVDLANSTYYLDPAATGMALNAAGDGTLEGGEIFLYDSNTYVTGDGTNLSFKDSYLTAPLALSESGATQLHAGFTTNSLVAALNELMNISLGDSTNISLNAFREQQNEGILYKLFQDGIADEFEGLDAIDINASAYIYDSTYDYFGRANPPGQILHDTETEFDTGATQDNTVSSVSPQVTLAVKPITGDGEDGSITVSATKNINSDPIATDRIFADGVAYQVTGFSSNSVTMNEAPHGIEAGDEVILINMQGDLTNFDNVGNYEFLTVNTVNGSDILFTSTIQEDYGVGGNITLTGQSIILQRVPHYNDVTIASGGDLTAGLWDRLATVPTTPTSTAGYQTGIVAFRANGIVDIQSGGTIDVDALGYEGGDTYGSGAYPGGEGGESICGEGGAPANYEAGTAGTGAGGGGGPYNGGNGTAGTCGGGGGDNNGAKAGSASSGGSGGGGGGHGGTGGAGGYGTYGEGGHGNGNGTDGGTNTSGAGGVSNNAAGGGGGGTYGDEALSTLFLGSGGANGGRHTAGTPGTGGDGGGIIFISSDTLTVDGTVTSDGSAGGNATGSGCGGGGGAAGGSIYIQTDTATIGSTLITATGGTGGTGAYGSGKGNAGDGRIAIDANTVVSGTSDPTYYDGSLSLYKNYGILTSDELNTANATSFDNAEWIESLATYGEVQVMTRSGATSDSTDGSWEEWKPITASNETVIDNMDAHTNWTGYTPLELRRRTETQFATAVGNERVEESGDLDGKLTIDRYVDEGDGTDGDVTISTSKNINTDVIEVSRTYADGVVYAVSSMAASSLDTSATPNGIVAGDEVLIINLKGDPSSFSSAGNYEFKTVASVASSTITFESAISGLYGVGENSNLTGQAVVIQRIPQYEDVTIQSGGTITASVWDKTSGGIVAFRASGTVDVQSGGAIDVDALGYEGGDTYGGGAYPGGEGGEAFCDDGGTGATYTAGTATTGAGGGGGPYNGGNGAAGICGGGGGDNNGAKAGSASYGGAGGGGGGHGGTGGAGGYGTAGEGGHGNGNGTDGGTNTSGAGGVSNNAAGGGGGGTYGDEALSQMFFGAGGANGGRHTSGTPGTGGDGGGIIFVTANTLTVSGTISSDGSAGGNATGASCGGGGGAAGGSVYIQTDTATIGSTLITADGGIGGTGAYGSGKGNAGDGRIRLDANELISGTTSPTYYDGLSLDRHHTSGIFTSDELATTNANIYDNIEWVETLGNVGEIQVMTRSGATSDSTDGSWEGWKPVTNGTNLLTVDALTTHTDWTGTNMTVAEGDITRNEDYYEDDDEATATNLAKFSTSTQDGYAENDLGLGNELDLTNYDYISFWIRSDVPDDKFTLGMGEDNGTQQEETVTIDTIDTWQKVYWDITDIAPASKNGIRYLRLTSTSQETAVIYLDQIEAGRFITGNTGTQIPSTVDEYIQYRVIMTTTNTTDAPELEELTINYRTSQTNTVSAEGGVARDLALYEDEDEATTTNMTKITSSNIGGYIYRDLGSGNEIDISSEDYISFWIYASEAGINQWKISMGEANGTEQSELIDIETTNTWQKVYWDISDITSTSRDAIRYFHLTYMGDVSVTAYMDDFAYNSYFTDYTGEAIASTPADYIQYRVFLSTTTNTITPYISTLQLDYTSALGNNLDTQSEFDTGTSKFQASSSANPDVRLAFNRPSAGDGSDGSITVISSKNINTDTLASNRYYADGIAYETDLISTNYVTLPYEANGISDNDEVLMINLRGDNTNFDNVGNYEFLKVASTSGKTVYFTSNIQQTYGVGNNDDLTGQSIVIQRVPHYNDVTVQTGGTITASVWDKLVATPSAIAGYHTGIVAFRASGETDVQTGGTITTAALGYEGGDTYGTGNYPGGEGGEAFCGDGGAGANYASGTAGTGAGGGGGPYNGGNGAIGICGGGGGDNNGAKAGSASYGGAGGGGAGHGGGGGGGGYGTFGEGGNGSSPGTDGGTNTSGAGGVSINYAGGGGGGTYGDEALSQMFYGAGGANGGRHTAGASGAGGDGGGIIFISSNALTVDGTITADGASGVNAGTSSGGGGGAAGGSIYIQADTTTLGVETPLVTANGGTAGTQGSGSGNGDGGDGRIRINTNTINSGETSPTYYSGQDTGAYYPYAIFTSDEINTAGAATYDSISWSETLGSYGEIQLMTRSGSTTDSTDGSWEAWKPVVGGTNLLSLNTANTHADWTGYTPGSIITDTQAEFNAVSTVDFRTGSTATPSASLGRKYNDGDSSDGDITISSSKNINTDLIATGRTEQADGIAYEIESATASGTTVGAVDTPNGIVAGDEVLLINLRGENGDVDDVGNYEFLDVSSVSGNDITFTSSIANSYDGTTPSNQKVVIQRIPQYDDVTIQSGGTITASVWDKLTTTPTGTAGYHTGIVAFRASGTVDVQSGGAIDVDALGYEGGDTYGTSNYPGGEGGEAFCGDGGAGANYAGGTAGTGAGGGGGPYNGGNGAVGLCGGGGGDNNGAKAGSASYGGAGGGGAGHGGGGGGGGYGTAGEGGNGSSPGTDGGTNTSGAGGVSINYAGGGGGGTYGDEALSQMFFGAGGGNGGRHTNGVSGAGGDGGGIIFITANSLDVEGTISSDGAAGAAAGGNSGGGGGGAGGSVFIQTETATLRTILVSANGGAAGTQSTGSGNGKGGAGRIRLDTHEVAYGSTAPTFYPGNDLEEIRPYGVYTSDEFTTNQATAFERISWSEIVDSYSDIQFMTRSGNTADSRSDTWEEWKPVGGSSSTSIEAADTHTDWVGTNITVTEGDVTRDVDYYEDEDEATATDLTKMTTSTQNGYAENDLGGGSEIDLSSYDYLTFWIRSSKTNSNYTIGMGEAAATEQTQTINIEKEDVWQKVYWDITDITGTARDAIRYLRLTYTDDDPDTITTYIDNISAQSFHNTPSGSEIDSSVADYIQYRAIFSTTDTTATNTPPSISSVKIDYASNSSEFYSLEGDITRDIDLYEDEDESTITDITKLTVATTTADNDFVETTLSSTDLSNYDYIAFWIRTSSTSTEIPMRVGLGETIGDEYEMDFVVETPYTWQKVFFDITAMSAAEKDAITKIRLTNMAPSQNSIYIDNFIAARYLTNASSSSVPSTPDKYIQYRAILSTSDTAYFPTLNSITFQYSGESVVLSEDQIANVLPKRVNLISWADIGTGSLTYYGSRDAGTTWTEVTMTEQATESGDLKIYSGYADISAQPAGTDMKWKVVVGGNAQLHAMSMRWESGGGADLAEWYPTHDQSLAPAEVISADTTSSKSGYIKRSEKAYDPTVLGIISTAPGVQIGEMADNTKRVALAGRVPVLIASDSAAIKTGDFLVSSHVPGRAMKAVKTGYTIGKALEDWTPGSDKETVMTFVNLGTHIDENDIGGVDKSSLEDIFGENVLGATDTATDSASLDEDPTASGSAETSEATGSAEASGSALLNTATDSANLAPESLTSKLKKIAQERLDAMFNFSGQEESTDSADLNDALNLVTEDSIAESQQTLWEARDKFVDYGSTVGNIVGASTINAFNGLNAASATIYGRLVATSADIYGKLTAVSGEFIDLFANRVETNELATDMISPIDPDGVIKFRLGANSEATGSGTLVVEDASGSAVTTFDDQGNITTLGDLIANEVITSTVSAEVATFIDASISGQLDTTSARIEQLESKLAQIEELDAQTAEIVNATISGTLFADDINEFGDKVAAAIEEPTLLEKLLGTADATNTVETIDNYFADHDSFVTELDTDSATRLGIEDLTLTEEDLVIDATAVYVDQYFDVNGSAYIAENLGLGQSLVLSDSMYITAGSIDYAPTGISKPTLNIQPSGKGLLSLMAGLFTLDDSGLAQINGDLTVTGDLRVNKTLLTNVISANDFTNPFQVQLATMSGEVLGEETVTESRFEIVNELGVPVATISAQGKADFSSGIGIGSETLESTDSAQIESEKTSGTATIKSGSSEIVIKSPIVSDQSLIYVTPLGSTNNKVLYVKELTNDDPETSELESYFKVGFDTNVTNDVKFNWWIVN
jgi:hypothetical protein